MRGIRLTLETCDRACHYFGFPGECSGDPSGNVAQSALFDQLRYIGIHTGGQETMEVPSIQHASGLLRPAMGG